jgi:hypothetical protein
MAWIAAPVDERQHLDIAQRPFSSGCNSVVVFGGPGAIRGPSDFLLRKPNPALP